MNLKKSILGVGIFLIVGISSINAQQAVLSSGGNATGSGGSATYSIGQTVYNTSTSGSGSVNQGVHQPYEISEITSISENSGIQLKMIVFPNPTADLISMQVDDLQSGILSYQLMDFSGKIIHQDVISENLTQVDMSNLTASTYIIEVFQNEKLIKSFKIIKN